MISKQKVTVVATRSATLCLLWIKFGSQCSVPSMPLIYYKANQRCCSLHHTSAVMCLCSSKITVQPIPAENKIDNIQQKPLLRERQDKISRCFYSPNYRFWPCVFSVTCYQPIIYLPMQDTPSSAKSVPGSQKQMTFWVSRSTRHSSISQWLQLRCSLISTSPCPSVTREWMKEATLNTGKIIHLIPSGTDRKGGIVVAAAGCGRGSPI